MLGIGHPTQARARVAMSIFCPNHCPWVEKLSKQNYLAELQQCKRMPETKSIENHRFFKAIENQKSGTVGHYVC
jgi:hypothetical protein